MTTFGKTALKQTAIFSSAKSILHQATGPKLTAKLKLDTRADQESRREASLWSFDLTNSLHFVVGLDTTQELMGAFV